MRDISGKEALVTGAGSGIGRATAQALAERGAKLVLCDINDESLQRAVGELSAITEIIHAARVDVASSDEMRALADVVHAKVSALDILVNNAGVGLAASFLNTSLEDWNWVLGINLHGVVHGCHFFVPKMAERGQGGHVATVSSLLGFWPAPEICGYTTAKFGVLGLSLAMREDLRAYNIGVSAICPGIINTNIVNTARMVGFGGANARCQMQAFYKKRNLGPEVVARAIVRAIERNKEIVPVGVETWFAYYLNRLGPALGRVAARKTAQQIMGPNAK